MGGLIQRFQGPNHGEQFEALAVQIGFHVGGLDLLGAIGRAEDELPMAHPPRVARLGKQQIVWCGNVHRSYGFRGLSRFLAMRSMAENGTVPF